MVKSHPRNRAGTVTLRSADPLDTPEIQFNFFNDEADAELDFETIYESINLGREAFKRQAVEVAEILPGPDVKT